MSEADAISERRREIGRRLAAERKDAGYTQRDFAGRISYARSTLSTVESGIQRAGPAFWEACDRVLRTGGTFAASYDQLQGRPARTRQNSAHRLHVTGPGALDFQAATVADALRTYQALGWPVTAQGATLELATGTVVDALEVPQAAGKLAVCWWRCTGGVADAVRGLPALPDPRRALAVIAWADRYFFLGTAGCHPWAGPEVTTIAQPAADAPMISWHSTGSRIPAPPSGSGDDHPATWVCLPVAGIELGCPVVLLDLLAKAITTSQDPQTLALPGGVLAIPAIGVGGHWDRPAGGHEILPGDRHTDHGM